jgi:hypothetical protein
VPLIERYESEGTVCLSAGTNEGLQFHVLLDDCASYCSDVEASCSADRQDGVIDLISTGEAINPDGHLDCPDRCLMVVARCSLAGLAPGPYTLRYGAESAAIELPISVPLTQVFSDDEQASCARVEP